MQAIHTKYLPATNSRGSRIKATCDRGSITIPYPYKVERTEVHRESARALIAKFVADDLKQYGTPPDKNPWNTPFVSGGLPDGSEVHVFTVRAAADSETWSEMVGPCGADAVADFSSPNDLSANL